VKNKDDHPVVVEKFQRDRYSCGLFNLYLVLRMLGHKVSIAKLRRMAGTTRDDGTNEKKMAKTVRSFGHQAKCYQVFSGERAWNWLCRRMAKGQFVFICCDDEDHWITAKGIFGNKIWIYDPLPYSLTVEKPRRYNTSELFEKETLLSRWGCVNKSGKISYFAISITV